MKYYITYLILVLMILFALIDMSFACSKLFGTCGSNKDCCRGLKCNKVFFGSVCIGL